MRLSPRPRAELESEGAALLQRVELELGTAPLLFELLSHSPAALRGVWALLEATLLEGQIPRTTKELILLAASASAGVLSLAGPLRAGLEERGLDPAVLSDLVSKGETPRLPERTQQVLSVGRRAALQPALLEDADMQRLRRLGFGDSELAELLSFGGSVALLIALSRGFGALEAS